MSEKQTPEAHRDSVGLPLALLAHVATLAVCGLAVYSVFASPSHALDAGDVLHRGGVQGLPLLLALGLALPILFTKGLFAQHTVGRLLAATGIVYVFSLSADREIADNFLPAFARSLQLSWSAIVVIVGGIAWGVCVLAGVRLPFRATGFEAPALIAALGLALLAVGCGFAFAREYPDEANALAIVSGLIRLGIYVLIFVAALCLSGARRIGPAIHLYTSAALVIGLGAMYALHCTMGPEAVVV
ncbi:MAG: hypothetical protein ACE5O2_03835, partial [Armatimonadota bacterium]